MEGLGFGKAIAVILNSCHGCNMLGNENIELLGRYCYDDMKEADLFQNCHKSVFCTCHTNSKSKLRSR